MSDETPKPADDVTIDERPPTTVMALAGLLIFGATDERPFGALTVDADAIVSIERTWGKDPAVAMMRRSEATLERPEAVPPLTITLRTTASYQVDCREMALFDALITAKMQKAINHERKRK